MQAFIMIAHSFQLHGRSKQVELMQTDNISVECLFRARLQMLVHQGIIDS